MKKIQQLMRASTTTNTMTIVMIKVFDLLEPPSSAVSAIIAKMNMSHFSPNLFHIYTHTPIMLLYDMNTFYFIFIKIFFLYNN